MLSTFHWIYLLSDTFGTYIVFKFMCVFFDRTKVNRKIEYFSYIVFYIIASLIFLAFNNLILNIISNLVFLYLLTLNYRATIRKRLMATLFIYVFLAVIEILVAFVPTYINLDVYGIQPELIFIIEFLSMKILSYIVVLVLSNYKMVKEKTEVSLLHWVAVFLIPSGTFFSTIVFLIYGSKNNYFLIITGIAILFIINIFVFYLYDALIHNYQDKLAKEILQQQNNSYLKQFEIINQSQSNFKILRHDVKNHLFALQSLLKSDKKLEALEYIKSIFENMENTDEISKSGNTVVDSILNYKLSQAKENNIKIDLSINIPEKLNIESFDLSAILGNLLDNSIEACTKISENKLINVSLDFYKNVLFINISNTYDNINYPVDKDFKTNKEDNENHGYGLQSVKNCIERYNGKIEFNYDKNVFNVDVLLYNQ